MNDLKMVLQLGIDSEAMNKVKFFVNLLPFKRIPFVV